VRKSIVVVGKVVQTLVDIMNTLPRISVITPSFNQGKYIEATIHSVLGQDYPNLEYIIMDGGSSDNTLSILRRYEDRVIWFSEKDRGQSHAINKGLRCSTGEIVAFLNSDDIYENGALMAVGQYFQNHPAAMWLTGQCKTVDENLREVRKWVTFYKDFWLRLKSYPALLVLNYISQPATFWRKSLVDEVGFIDEELCFVMDYDYWLRIGRCNPLHVIPKNLASFRTHTSSKTRSLTKVDSDEELNMIRRYTNSSVILALHRLHRKMMIGIYRRLK
jgi:glycosyltransferase involved in cell wall biosynthesis